MLWGWEKCRAQLFLVGFAFFPAEVKGTEKTTVLSVVGVIPKNRSSFWLLNPSELGEGGLSSPSNKPQTQRVHEILELPFSIL